MFEKYYLGIRVVYSEKVWSGFEDELMVVLLSNLDETTDVAIREESLHMSQVQGAWSCDQGRVCKCLHARVFVSDGQRGEEGSKKGARESNFITWRKMCDDLTRGD